MASLPSILILGADAVAAAGPATPVQLVHACRSWGFSAVVPASWGDELIATNVIRQCSARANRPLIQCSCPRVASRLATHAAVLEDAICWLISPPVAAAKYLRAVAPDRDIHVTYAGSCPGAADSSIDECITPYELLAALSVRGIDPAAQPTIFENVIPADRRRYASSAGGLPEPHQLWEGAHFRLSQPADTDLAVAVAQLLLAEERILVDLSPALGCVCRTADHGIEAVTVLHRSSTPIVASGRIDVRRSPPVAISEIAAVPAPSAVREAARTEPIPMELPMIVHEESVNPPQSRPTATRSAYRRQSTWRRQTPRAGVVVLRPSTIAPAVNERLPLMRRPETLVITALLITAMLIVVLWVGRRPRAAMPGPVGTGPASGQEIPMLLGRSRSP